MDFAAILAHRRRWIWLYRVYLFGYVVGVMAFVALATLAAGTPSRIIVWPAVAVLGTGLMMAAVAAAFYYHFGAWGSVDMDGKPPEAVRAFIDSLRVSTEYVTCLVRSKPTAYGRATRRASSDPACICSAPVARVRTDARALRMPVGPAAGGIDMHQRSHWCSVSSPGRATR